MMATTTLSPTLVQKFFDNTGAPLAFGLLSSYQAGTNTPLAAYKDSGGVAQNTNPIQLNARGECLLWIPPNVAYKFNLTDASGNTIPGWPIDNVVNSQLITLYGGVDTGIANAYILNFTASFTSYSDGIIIYWIPANNNTGSSTINVNGLGPVNITNVDGSALIANQLASNQVAQILCKGGQFVLVSPAQLAGTFTATFASGWTTAPTLTLSYVKTGSFVCIYFSATSAFTATSNSALSQLSGVPAALRPSSKGVKASPCRLIDNNTVKGGWASVDSVGNINLGLGFDNLISGFTNSGIKGIDSYFMILYPLV